MLYLPKKKKMFIKTPIVQGIDGRETKIEYSAKVEQKQICHIKNIMFLKHVYMVMFRSLSNNFLNNYLSTIQG